MIKTAEEIVNARRIVLGPDDNYRGVRPLKYPWTTKLLKTMTNNGWSPDTVSLTKDKYEIFTLTDGQRLCHKRNLAFLSNLDSIQLNNLALNISGHITSHEIKRCLNRQIWEEEVHVESYSQIIESTCTDAIEIYMMAEDNPLLKDKNGYITSTSDNIRDAGFSLENFALAIDANVALEGIYFFSGFLSGFAIGRSTRKMLGTVDMLKYIMRDELTHLDLFTYLRRDYALENPEIYQDRNFQDLRIQQFINAAKKETRWGCHLIEGGVLGLTDDIIKGFIEYLTDLRAQAVGLPVIFGTKNPVPWFDDYSSLDKGVANTFERRGKEYQAGGGGLVWE